MSKRNPYDRQRVLFIQLLQQVRCRQKITQITLSERLNKPQSFVSKYENSERILDIVEIYQICQALDIKFIELMQQFHNKVNLLK